MLIGNLVALNIQHGEIQGVFGYINSEKMFKLHTFNLNEVINAF